MAGGIVQLLQLPILTPILISAKKFNLLKQLWGIIPHRPKAGGMIWMDAPSSKIKKDLSNREISLFTSAADRNRTGTGITTHGILSP